MKLKILLTLSLILSIFTARGITLNEDDAITYVLEHMTKDERTADVELWIGQQLSKTWLVVVDPTPEANWGHKVYYYYLKQEYQDDPFIIKDVRDFMPDVRMVRKYYNETSHNSTSENFVRNVEKREVPVASRQYALIISGGLNAQNNHLRYWNDCSYIYRVLRSYYNVPKDNIYLSMSDGTDPKIDQKNKSQNLDLDSDGEADIEYAATISDLTNIFQELKDRMTLKDHLLIYVIDHGGFDKDLESSYICLWNSERLYPEQLNAWLDDINAGSINCVFGQCFSGGFIDPLKANNRIIAAACGMDEYSYGNGDNFDGFVDAWTSALMNVDSYENEEVFCSDINGDNMVSMDEAYSFAEYYDIFGPYNRNLEHPEYFAGDDILAADLCIDRHPYPVELIIRDDENDMGIEPNVEGFLNNSPDIWIRNSNDGKTDSQLPKFTTVGAEENYVYVRIKNKGLFDYIPSEGKKYLHLNWAEGAPALKYSSYSGQFVPSGGTRIGYSIKSVYLDKIIPSGEEYIVCVPWKTQDYKGLWNGEPLSILATISDQPYGLAYDVTRNYYKDITIDSPSIKSGLYKNVAVKSAWNPTQITAKEWVCPINIQGLDRLKDKAYSLEIQSGNQKKLYDFVRFYIHLPDGLRATLSPLPQSESIQKESQRRIVINNDSIINLEYDDESLYYLVLNNNAWEKIKISAEPKENADKKYSGPLSAVLVIRQYPNDDIVGTYTFNFNINRGTFTALSSKIITNKLDESTIELSFEDNSNEENIVNHIWTNDSGEVLGEDKVLIIDPQSCHKVNLLTIYDDNQIDMDTVVIDSGVKIEDITVNKSSCLLEVKLNSALPENLTIVATSITEPYLKESVTIKGGEKSTILSTSKLNNSIIIVSLYDKIGNLLDSRTVN